MVYIMLQKNSSNLTEINVYGKTSYPIFNGCFMK